MTTHRKPRTSTAAKTAVRLGMIATAGMAVAATTTTAQASSGSSHSFMSTAVDMADTHADRMHVNQFDESFKIHQFGPLVAVTANNRATAESAGCSVQAPCRSIALSFQIVTAAGRNARLVNATNISRSANDHCPGCETFAGAYQFVVATPQELTLSKPARSQLARIHREVAGLRRSHLAIPDVKKRADELAQEVKTVLDREAASAPHRSAASPPDNFRPTVTMHRHVD
ncbi:hypothetical protein [Streptomyces aureus]|uniref:hypothetical protein n=1 Tax=Streptomyces aureus TaxID=193461 RepID=UPI0005631DDD|nr:hypothetical protein [Streptomyces aureus]